MLLISIKGLIHKKDDFSYFGLIGIGTTLLYKTEVSVTSSISNNNVFYNPLGEKRIGILLI